MRSFPITASSVWTAAGRTHDLGDRLRSGSGGLRPQPDAAIAAPLGVISPLAPLLGDLRRFDSRAARVLAGCLADIQGPVEKAISRWGAERVGIVLGSSTGGFERGEEAYRHWLSDGELPQDYDFNDCQAFHGLQNVARAVSGARGPSFVISTACSSSAKALASAQRLIQVGICDAVICGGADGLCAMTLLGFSSLRVYSPTGSKPFDPDRDGMSIGEGGTALLLEREGSADVYMRGAGETHDAHHPTAPHPEGDGAARAMQEALNNAGLDPSDVGYVNAHGTGTGQNDATETKAILRVCGARVPVSSTKDRTGHLLGGAGGAEAWIASEVLTSGKIVPSTYQHPAEGTAKDASDEATLRLAQTGDPSPRHALSNSLAFGGNNTCVALSREARAPGPEDSLPKPGALWVMAAAAWSPYFETLAHAARGEFAKEELAPPPSALLSARARGRATLIVKLHAAMMDGLNVEGREPLSELAWFFASSVGAGGMSVKLADQAIKNALSPASFQSSVHNASTGLLSIAAGHKGFATAIAAGPLTTAMGLIDAEAWLRCHGDEAVLVFAEEGEPAPLVTEPYAPLGVGLRVRLSETEPAGALCRLTTPVLGEGASLSSALRDALAGELPAPALASILANPVSPALGLALRAFKREAGEVALAPEWATTVS